MTSNAPPLVVDLDGTLLRSDLLLETGIAFLRSNPLQLLKPFIWLLKGKASLKEGLAKDSHVDVTVLPYDPAVITLIEQARASGRSIVLATASHISLANRVADHLQIFDKVVATNGSLNLSSHLKRDVLVEQYGNEGFDYIGNSLDDIVVWASARKAYVVNPERGVEKRAAAQGNVEEIIRSNTTRPKDWIKALRLHQWMKNILIFVPLLTAHLLTNIPFVLQGLLAFLFFGLCASSVYLLNDLLDLNDDRHHKSKRNRPFASGKLSIRVGLLAFPSLLGIAFIGSAVLLPWEFTATLIGYYILTLAYSLSMKRKMVVDVISLALLYTIRIIAGACALNLELTFWILAFSMFMFLSLALVKRYAELREAKHSGRTEKTRGRGYYPDDLEMISSLGAASGYLAVMVLAMYIHDPATTRLYSHPQIIWLACPILLFWISRIWMLTHRGKMHDDPVMFAVSDRTSIVAGLLMGLVFWVAA
ncbi:MULTISPECIES: UbiA family prenyltransferase [Pseudomonas]|uniref:4-hydroxybenzoate octaprenyltransferase n=1 Tax=Pseudomonas fluorescens TaxID=294 RepID=A0A5E7MKW2_PSEFL|nr:MULTISPECIES: UbiA family prenyltransferase [Pseudomonas]UST94010.1 UbiA family prenyltransferase [Pseudomonas siliginis]VVP25190.1 4-hydroxybenzoate octaprenyltransferase [Pseudomonas fluorescens]